MKCIRHMVCLRGGRAMFNGLLDRILLISREMHQNFTGFSLKILL